MGFIYLRLIAPFWRRHIRWDWRTIIIATARSAVAAVAAVAAIAATVVAT